MPGISLSRHPLPLNTKYVTRDPHVSMLTKLQQQLLLLLVAFLLPSFCLPIQVMVSSDAAPTGLDIHGLPYVVNYDQRPAHLHAHKYCLPLLLTLLVAFLLHSFLVC